MISRRVIWIVALLAFAVTAAMPVLASARQSDCGAYSHASAMMMHAGMDVAPDSCPMGHGGMSAHMCAATGCTTACIITIQPAAPVQAAAKPVFAYLARSGVPPSGPEPYPPRPIQFS